MQKPHVCAMKLYAVYSGGYIMIKKLVKILLRMLLTPWRWYRHRHDGVLQEEARREIPNELLLGLVRDMLRDGGKDMDTGEEFRHHTATIWVKGYSMRPFLEHMRDKVVLAYPEKVLKVGDAVLAEISAGNYVLHRIIRREGEWLTLMGDGNVRGTERCRVQDVAGVVTHYVRPRRTISADDPKLVRRIRRWSSQLRFRRYLLLLYRATI